MTITHFAFSFAALENFGVKYEVWFSEQSLHDSGAVQRVIEQLQKDDWLLEEEGALWLDWRRFGEGFKPEVLVRANGIPTYFAADIAYLKEKTDAGLDFLTTQMFFDNNVYFRYLSRLRNAGITVPVIAGIMPVTNAVQIKRVCQLSGTYLPPRFRAIVDHFGENPMAMEEAGVAYATEQIFDLFANGADNVHVYTMNKPQIAEKIMANLSNALG